MASPLWVSVKNSEHLIKLTKSAKDFSFIGNRGKGGSGKKVARKSKIVL